MDSKNQNYQNNNMDAEVDLDKLQFFLNQNNILLNLTGRQRMLSQKIGFYCEMILRGGDSKVAELQKTIQLFENSLHVIKNGGIPPMMDIENEISPLDDVLLIDINLIESNWAIYKKSAENIAKFASFGNDNSEISNDVMRMQINIIENNGESLLKSCNNLVNSCSNFYKLKILELYNRQ